MMHTKVPTRGSMLLSVALLLAGCAGQPKTADQLRDNVKRDAIFSTREVIEVKKPYAEVSATLRKKWIECFDTTTTGTVHRGGNTFSKVTYAYKPKIAVTAGRTELTLQQKIVSGSFQPGAPPEGFYIIVTDVYPLGKNASRVDVQKQMPGFSGAMKAIRHWAEGTNLGCPDLGS